MDDAPLGTAGLTVSRCCLGTMTFGAQADESTSHRILSAAADAGVTFLDTADVYPAGGTPDTVGRTEEIVGRWLQGQRAQFVVATKAGMPMGEQPWERGASRKHLLTAIDASLRRLGTDHVDLYQLHAFDKSTPLNETLRALDDIVRSGRARYVGCSNFFAYQVARAIGRSELHDLVKFVSVQPRYNLVFRAIERELLPLCAEEGLGVLTYNPLAGGLLTGKHHRDQPPREGTRFTLTETGAMYQKRYWRDREFATVDVLRDVASEAGVSMPSMAVSWVLANPDVTSVIVGASTVSQLADTLSAASTPMEPALKERLDAATSQYRSATAL